MRLGHLGVRQVGGAGHHAAWAEANHLRLVDRRPESEVDLPVKHRIHAPLISVGVRGKRRIGGPLVAQNVYARLREIARDQSAQDARRCSRKCRIPD